MKISGKFHCVVLGVSYKTCPVALRDKLSLSLKDIAAASKSIWGLPGVSEVVVLSTCNRSEIYVATLYPEALADTLVNWWAEYAKVDFDEIVPHCYYLAHAEAVSHIYSVVSSIDSLVIGENQILGQVKEAFRKAQELAVTGVLLNHLFQSAFALGKQVREQTGIGGGTISVAHAAMELCRKELGELSGKRVGILGLGEMGRLSATTFAGEGVTKFAFFNRTFSKARDFVSRFGGDAYELQALAKELPRLDILITCAASDTFLLQASNLPGVLRSSLMIVDIATPRNVDPLVGSLPGIRLFCLDDLNKVVERNRELRRQAAERAREFIENAAEEFRTWFASRELAPLLSQMRDYHTLVGEMVLKKWREKVTPEVYETLERFEDELRKKVLHVPFAELRRLGSAGLGLESQLVLEKLYPTSNLEEHFSRHGGADG